MAVDRAVDRLALKIKRELHSFLVQEIVLAIDQAIDHTWSMSTARST